jgi:cell fate (sporulation/competence/biofilm development) regulator YlbF (YheA/YmcA/DUF963 family)
MDNNNESTSVATETNNNAWQLVKPSKDDIATLTSLLEDYDGIDIEGAQSDFESAFEDAQAQYNEVVEWANDKLREIRELIQGSDWGKSLVNYEDELIEKNQPLHQLLHGLTGIDDFLSDFDRHDECLDIYDNGGNGNSDDLNSVIEDLEALEKFEEVDETLDQDTEGSLIYICNFIPYPLSEQRNLLLM